MSLKLTTAIVVSIPASICKCLSLRPGRFAGSPRKERRRAPHGSGEAVAENARRARAQAQGVSLKAEAASAEEARKKK